MELKYGVGYEISLHLIQSAETKAFFWGASESFEYCVENALSKYKI
ncbi:hypothetical protein [Sedimentibacter sp.]|nr:hypothetical protein [Sedimentibacter sp.]